MSEHMAYVACRCFRDGLTSEPPIPVEELDTDQFGNVKLKASQTGEDDPEDLYDWRMNWLDGDESIRVCAHEHMRVVETIWTTRGWQGDRSARLIASGEYPHLHEVISNGDLFGSTSVIATPQLAARALPELESLLSVRLEEMTRIIVDENNVDVYVALDPDGYVASTVFTGLVESRWPFEDPPGLLRLGVEGMELVVRDERGSPHELLRGTELLFRPQTKDQSDFDSAYDNDFFRAFVRDVESEHQVTGTFSRIWFRSNQDVPSMTSPTTIRVQLRELTVADLGWYLRPLRAFLKASIETGNPVVGYYNGRSLGYD